METIDHKFCRLVPTSRVFENRLWIAINFPKHQLPVLLQKVSAVGRSHLLQDCVENRILESLHGFHLGRLMNVVETCDARNPELTGTDGDCKWPPHKGKREILSILGSGCA